MLSVFSADGYLAYSPFLKPIIAGGVRCVAIDRVLEHRDPPAYAFLLQFARDSQLKRRSGRRKIWRPMPQRAVCSPVRKARLREPACPSLPQEGRRETAYAIALTAADRRLL